MSENKNENRSRVLIVEDEFLIALDLEAAMTGLGFEICGLAPNGDEARLLAMDHQPDVVLVDVYLGGAREGIETARWLRDVCDASVVFVTAHTDAATVERIKEVVPGSPILSKPVYREHSGEGRRRCPPLADPSGAGDELHDLAQVAGTPRNTALMKSR